MPIALRKGILERDLYTCQDCGRVFTSWSGVFGPEVHHIRPWVLGGAHSPENLVTLCGDCHRTRDRPLRLAGVERGKTTRMEKRLARKPREPTGA